MLLSLCQRPSYSNYTSLFPKFHFLIRWNLYSISPFARYSSRQFLQTTVKSVSTQRIYASNVQIGALARAGKLKDARQVFDKMPQKDVVSWNAIVTGYWQNGLFDESKRLFELIPLKNVISWNSMIAGCVQNDRIDEAYQYFTKMPERNTASWNAMVSGFVRYGRIEEAKRLFDEMPQRNVISYTAMIDGYTQIGEIERARALFDSMRRKNDVSWVVMISGYVENDMFAEARELFDLMPEKNVVAITAMITGYCKERKMGSARMLFEEIQNRDLVSWNAMIAGYAQNGDGVAALKLHSQMLKICIKPDHSTFVSLLTACSSLASLKEGREIHLIVVRSGFESDLSICNALITMYSKCGSISDSVIVFGLMNCPDLVSWNAIIAGYAQHGHYEKALGLFNEMELNGIKPDGITFLSVLSACDHAGKVEESMEWFNTMLNGYGIAPRAEHYACLVDILSRAGHLDEAYKIIQQMPFEPDTGAWGPLLAACRVHLNVELGEIAANKLVKLEPQDSGAYIMLSNIYAAAGMWEDVTRMRGLMKEQGVKKQTAYSWTEIGNEVHFFSGGDISHPEIHRIHLELKRIGLQMKMFYDFEDIET
ncbi:pentatricopeptide repeat-containing protein At4g02750-like [Macadamia integrifolia]|uniref:pentatricopeptide repeat-containing protein At4g02750-like n=1 Tax=Macadamia integrifolia TaxID=60698 RepID=UPI001C4F7BD5|nr:pentatricopeptide repeat-containing protein At4g02750-like [Macadamia integrifolia]